MICGKDCTVPVTLLRRVTSVKRKGLQAERKETGNLLRNIWQENISFLLCVDCVEMKSNTAISWAFFCGGEGKKVAIEKYPRKVSWFSEGKELTYDQNELSEKSQVCFYKCLILILPTEFSKLFSLTHM